MDIYDNKKLIESVNKILSGNGILFTGAGFSLETKNIRNQEPPLAGSLSKKISKLIPDFEEDDDLMYVSDYYIKKNYDINKLIQLLRNEFTIKEVSPHHQNICKMNWKRIYTTNYDNTIKKSFTDNDNDIQAISANDKSSENYNKNNNLCIHINGRIDSLTVKNINTSFKLSDSSYMSPENFVNSFWYRQFKLDLERTGVIFFIGYSLYDLDIKKILFDNEIYKEKTFFIIRKDASEKEVFQLEQYGNVLAIGLDGIANIFQKVYKDYIPIEENFYTEAFTKYTINNNNNQEIIDKNIEDFLQYGNLDAKFKSDALLSTQTKPCLIIRNKLRDINYLLDEYQYLFILGDFGNGKSIFLEEVMIKYVSENKNVFYLKDFNSNYLVDIEKINNLNTLSYLIIDGYAQCLDIFEFIFDNPLSNIKFIFSERTTVHNGLKNDFKITQKSAELSVDKMQDNEMDFFIDIVDNIGYWGDKSKMSIIQKKETLKKNNSEISLNLLSLFDSNHIKDRLQNIINSIDRPDYKNTLFAICLIEAIGVEPEQSLISEVALSNTIYENSFKNDKAVSQIFQFKGNELISKSSLFSLYVLKNTFSATYMIDRLILLSNRFNEIQYDNYINKEISKYLLRFNFIQKILPGKRDEQNNSLVQYYEKLKTSMNWLKKDIHYWLQYGMCKIALGEYQTAQKYLETAYSFALNRDYYDTVYIDSQQSRLYLIQSLETHIAQESFSLFEKAHYLLLTLPDDGYKYKRVKIYYDIYSKHFINFSKKNKIKFYQACETMLDSVKNITRNMNYENYSVNRTYDTCQENLETIIKDKA